MSFGSGYCHKQFHTQPKDEGGLFPAKTHSNKMKMDFAAGVNSSESCKNIFSWREVSL